MGGYELSPWNPGACVIRLLLLSYSHPPPPPPRYLSMASITITAAGVISFLISHALPTAEPPLAKPILKSIAKGV